MKNIKIISEVETEGKQVLVRADLEVEAGESGQRFLAAKEIVSYLESKGAGRIKVIGHEGREWVAEHLGVETIRDIREDPREEENSEQMARELAEGFDIYVNEAFATSHRRHTSICALPEVMANQEKEVCIGLRFAKEMEMLSQVLNKPGRKLLAVSGIKVKDKLGYAVRLAPRFDKVILGGRIPAEYSKYDYKIPDNFMLAKLREDMLDLDEGTIEMFKSEIEKADVIVVAGVMGKFEDPAAEKGTKEIMTAIANNGRAYKVLGGGDGESAIVKYGLRDKFDWVSVGGGAMLEFLAAGTLVGLEAVKRS